MCFVLLPAITAVHQEIYPSDGGASIEAGAPAHRLDEFPTGYSSAGWSPPLPTSASPAASEYAVNPPCRSITFKRTERCVLSICLSRGGKRMRTLQKSLLAVASRFSRKQRSRPAANALDE